MRFHNFRRRAERAFSGGVRFRARKPKETQSKKASEARQAETKKSASPRRNPTADWLRVSADNAALRIRRVPRADVVRSGIRSLFLIAEFLTDFEEKDGEMRGAGVEPAHLSIQDPKSWASANSASRAGQRFRTIIYIPRLKNQPDGRTSLGLPDCDSSGGSPP